MRISIGIAIGIACIAGLFGYIGWYTLFRPVPGPFDGAGVSDEAYFKYGTIGIEPTAGIPFWIWVVLPEVFPDLLPGPGGYESLGVIQEAGQATPIGFPIQNIGAFPRVGLNCAICHTSAYRSSADTPEPVIVLGGTSQGFDVLSYQRFLFNAAADPRFNADVLLPKIAEANPDFSWFEQQFYRFLVIPGTKDALLETSSNWEWSYRNPDWGPGRIDPFNPVKFGILEQPVDDTIGNSDMLSIWNMQLREGMALHWDGLNTNLTEVVLSSAIGDGTTPRHLDLDTMARLKTFLEGLAPPEYPFTIDSQLAAEGQQVFNANCSACHTPGVGRTGQVIPVEEVGTDRHRVDMWGDKDAQAYNEKYADYDWKFEQFQDLDGYTAMPLDGIWLRAPYLHNGSVPSLADLLNPVVDRPQMFYRGYDVYDPEKVGFISGLPENPRTGIPNFSYDTSLPGNSNSGHLYGTKLSKTDQRALIEYLKTQ
ncbi:MAG: c-type cytochrome [Chloroflexi bacterium]|nr:c-type cytochrome [Chloroflexota bacterium]MDA1220180.1 c-type cytochrome [Chloroflexota bacterium]